RRARHRLHARGPRPRSRADRRREHPAADLGRPRPRRGRAARPRLPRHPRARRDARAARAAALRWPAKARRARPRARRGNAAAAPRRAVRGRRAGAREAPRRGDRVAQGQRRLGADRAERPQPCAPARRHRVRRRARHQRRRPGGGVSHWRGVAMPPMRAEALYGDRIVRCFAERPAGLAAMFARSRAARPDADAVVADGARWSYAQADAEAARIAAGLAALGVGARDRVVLLLGNRPEFLFVLLAVQRLGAIAVPVGTREQRPGVAYVARQCDAKAIVFDDELADRIPSGDDAPALALRIAASALARLPAANAPPQLDIAETDVAVLLYTSGTTGKPKGAMLTH